MVSNSIVLFSMLISPGKGKPIAAASLAKENTPTIRATSEGVIPRW